MFTNLVGENFTSAGSWSNTWDVPLHDANWRFADVNGDGRTDAVKQLGDGLSIRWGEASGMSDPVTAPFSGDLTGMSLTNANTHLQDFNGDGLADVVQTSDDDVTVFHGRGDGNFADAVSFNVNLAGFVGNQIRLADLNRDGITDLVLIDGSYVEWVPIYPTYRVGDVVPLESPDDGSEATVMITDFNGNGSQDVVWSSYNDLYYLDLAGPTHFGMLTSVQNGFGKTTTYAYSSSAALAQAALEGDEPWSFALPAAMPVPIQQTHTFASGEPDQVSLFSVRDGFWDGEERRFGGFLFSETVYQGASPTNTLVEEVIYHPGIDEERCLRGKVIQKTRKDGNGKVFDVTLNTYDARSLNLITSTNPKLKKALLTENTKSIYEGLADPITMQTTFAYNEYGQQTQVHHLGRLDLDNDQQITNTLYANNWDDWVLGKPAQTNTKGSSDGVEYNKTRSFYVDETGVTLPFQESGIGLKVKSEIFFAEEDRWITIEQNNYDTYGNLIWSESKGRTSENQYDGDGLFVIQERQYYNDTDFWAWDASWDKTLGVMNSLTSPDGLVKNISYDSLGRPISFSMNDDSPYVTYQYQLGSPFSTITAIENASTDFPFERVTVHNSGIVAVYSYIPVENNQYRIEEFAVHDERGQLKKTYENFFHSSDMIESDDLNDIGFSFSEFDGLGRETKMTKSNGVATLITYQPFEVRKVTEETAIETSTADGLGRNISRKTEKDEQVRSLDIQYTPTNGISLVSKITAPGHALFSLILWQECMKAVTSNLAQQGIPTMISVISQSSKML